MEQYKIEKDSIGSVRVPTAALWGANTQRSLNNFNIGTERMPAGVHRAVVLIKRAAAVVNAKLGAVNYEISRAIVQATDEALAGNLEDSFITPVWQTGSGAHTNMNVNEVLASRASQILSLRGTDFTVSPREHVNRSQSSNDVFSSAMHIAAVLALHELKPALLGLRDTLLRKSEEFMSLCKTGRTHMQDAAPLTLGQEIGGWAAMLSRDEEMFRSAITFLYNLSIGGTAVGTGFGAPKDFAALMAEEISHSTGLPFKPASNKFQALAAKDEICFAHGALKTLAMDMMKIAGDVMLLSSGPRAGIGEISIPANELGSLSMPGKANPTQCEAVCMVAAQVFGNDAAVAFAAGHGSCELNVYMPVMIFNFLQSCRLLTDVIRSFRANCAEGITANREKLSSEIEKSLMNSAALALAIGRSKAELAARTALNKNMTLREAVLELGLMDEESFSAAADPVRMCFPHGNGSEGK